MTRDESVSVYSAYSAKTLPAHQRLYSLIPPLSSPHHKVQSLDTQNEYGKFVQPRGAARCQSPINGFSIRQLFLLSPKSMVFQCHFMVTLLFDGDLLYLDEPWLL